MIEPMCADADPVDFDSILWSDHKRARRLCASCGMVPECLRRALEIAGLHAPGQVSFRGPDGTWAGLLWHNGSIVLDASESREVVGKPQDDEALTTRRAS